MTPQHSDNFILPSMKQLPLPDIHLTEDERMSLELDGFGPIGQVHLRTLENKKVLEVTVFKGIPKIIFMDASSLDLATTGDVRCRIMAGRFNIYRTNIL